MNIEYEATFVEIDKDKIREKLKDVGAKLIKPEFLQKRKNYFPPNNGDKGDWVRVRNEGDKITMSFKKLTNREKIDGQKEICLEVDNYKQAGNFLEVLGCRQKTSQESKREIWELDGVEICLDEWPFLEPFVEVEGSSEKEVELVVKKMGFDYSQAKFCDAGDLYAAKYGISAEKINNHTPKITFDMKNPFAK